MKRMHHEVETFSDLFQNGLGKSPGVLSSPAGRAINLGAGNSPIPFAENLDRPDWIAERDWLHPFPDECYSTVHAYHFFEHLSSDVFLRMLREVERVLVPGGVLNVCVPYARSDIAFQDPTHQTFFTEETWRTIFDNAYYEMDGQPWRLRVGYNIIAGVAGRNLCVFSQIMKEEE